MDMDEIYAVKWGSKKISARGHVASLTKGSNAQIMAIRRLIADYISPCIYRLTNDVETFNEAKTDSDSPLNLMRVMVREDIEEAMNRIDIFFTMLSESELDYPEVMDQDVVRHISWVYTFLDHYDTLEPDIFASCWAKMMKDKARHDQTTAYRTLAELDDILGIKGNDRGIIDMDIWDVYPGTMLKEEEDDDNAES